MVGWLEPGKMEHPQFREAIGGGAGSRRGSLHAQRRICRPACPNFVVPEVQKVCLCQLRKFVEEFRRVTKSTRPGKKTPGGAGTHTGHTWDTRAHKGTRITQRRTSHSHPNLTNPPLWSGSRGENTENAVPVKRHRGEPGHTQDTRALHGRTRAHGSHRRTSQPSQPTSNAPAARH